MNAYKIHRKSDGTIGGYGPNIDEYQPYLEDGDIIEYADVLPEMPINTEPSPVIITSENITIVDAELLMAAATAGEKTAEWLIAKLEL